jgi:hypothetical protein
VSPLEDNETFSNEHIDDAEVAAILLENKTLGYERFVGLDCSDADFFLEQTRTVWNAWFQPYTVASKHEYSRECKPRRKQDPAFAQYPSSGWLPDNYPLA